MVKRRTGLDPLAYLGVEPSMPAQFVRESRNPTTNDYSGFNIGTVWIVAVTNAIFMLVDKANLSATWISLTTDVSTLNTLTGDVGGIVPATANNIDIQGADHFVFTGDPPNSLLTLSSDGTVASTYTTDAGNATPAAAVLNVLGGVSAEGKGIDTTGAGNTVTVFTSGLVPLAFDGDAASVAIPAAGVLGIAGGNSITTGGAGAVMTVNVSGTTANAIQRGNAVGSITSLGLGTNGQVIIGSTGAPPAFATMTSAGGTILFTPGAATLNLEATGSGATQFDCDGATSASPLAGVIDMFGLIGGNITTAGDGGSTVTFAVSGTANFNPQMGNATGSLSDIGTMINGRLIIGSTGVAPVVNQLTAGTGIGIVNGPGTITISNTGSAGPSYATAAWVPVVAFDSQTVAPSYNISDARYVKIGANFVSISCVIELTARGTAPGGAPMRITGWPFSTNGLLQTMQTTVGEVIPGLTIYVSVNWRLLNASATVQQTNRTGSGVFNFPSASLGFYYLTNVYMIAP